MTGPAKQTQKEQFGLLQARVARNGVEHMPTNFAAVVAPRAKHILQQQAVILMNLVRE